MTDAEKAKALVPIFKELQKIDKKYFRYLSNELRNEIKKGKEFLLEIDSSKTSPNFDENRISYILVVSDGKLNPITLKDGTIIGYKAERVFTKEEVEYSNTPKHKFSVYEQNSGNLESDSLPKLIKAKGQKPSNMKRECDFEKAEKYFYENPNETTYTIPLPLIWYRNVEIPTVQSTNSTSDSQTIEVRFKRGLPPFENRTQASQAILSILKNVPNNQETTLPWTPLDTTTELDSEGNTLVVTRQNQMRTSIQTIIRITIYTNLQSPNAVNAQKITNTELMNQRLSNIGGILVGQNNLTNGDIRRGRRDSAVQGIVWNARADQINPKTGNNVILDRRTTTTISNITRTIIKPQKPIIECP